MKKLSKHTLDFNSALAYFKDNLNETNTLCSEILGNVDFQRGKFFTLLPSNANLTQIYEFEIGGILPQNPEEVCLVNEKSTYSIIPTIQTEISKFIANEIIANNCICVFDDVIRYPSDKKHSNLFYIYGITYDNEIYYVIKKEKSKINIIERCLEKSNAFWHSLCLLTQCNLKSFPDNKFTLEVIKDVCKNAWTIIVGAYDGEGYVFWEKTK